MTILLERASGLGVREIRAIRETQFRQYWIAKVFRAEAAGGPKIHQEYVVGDLCKQDLSSVTYVAKGLEHLIILVASQIRPAFSLKLFCAEGAALAVGFAGVPKDQGFFIAISAGLASLVLRASFGTGKVLRLAPPTE